ncbi:MAG: glycosyltransferase family 4 protein [Verrucomicrobia bacterium]|nr:glycosyltransferase family 4 protein [Verrucomicrobiota bacterium]
MNPAQPSGGGKKVFIYGGLLGQGAGAYLASWLLCRELESMGYAVTCFAQTVAWGGAIPQFNFRIVTPWVRHGCRWDWPGRCLTWQMRRMIRREKPDFVFCLGVIRQTRYLLQSEVASQLIVWELTNATPGNKFVDAEAVRLLGRCRAMLSPSVAIDENIRRNHGYQGPILRLPFWIEDWQQPVPETPEKFTADFIYLGRRDEEKGLRELVRATALVAREFPQVRVLIAGPGSAEPYATLAREAGVAGNVRFEFFASRADMMAALAGSRALILPSYHEGYPLVTLEAAQLGVPFVATAVGSIPEVFGASGAAVLCPPRDDRALAEAMLTLLRESAADYQARRQAARRVFEKVSSQQSIRRTLEAVIDYLRTER